MPSNAAIKHETSHLPLYLVVQYSRLRLRLSLCLLAAVPAPRADAHAITHLLPLYLVVQYSRLRLSLCLLPLCLLPAPMPMPCYSVFID